MRRSTAEGEGRHEEEGEIDTFTLAEAGGRRRRAGGERLHTTRRRRSGGQDEVPARGEDDGTQTGRLARGWSGKLLREEGRRGGRRAGAEGHRQTGRLQRRELVHGQAEG